MNIISNIICCGHTMDIESYNEYNRLKNEYLKKNNIKLIDFMKFLNDNLTEDTKERLTLSIGSRREKYLKELESNPIYMNFMEVKKEVSALLIDMRDFLM